MLWIEDFFSLVFPKICVACGNNLLKNEFVICTRCEYHLPKTGFHLDPENPASRLFWGRVRLENCASYLFFTKGEKVQRMIHHLKYKGRKDIGFFLGKRYGYSLRESPSFMSVEVIVPVPLHKKRLMQRGYNQSEQFANGLKASMGIPVDSYALIRTKNTGTQTKKSRFSRWENVAEMFYVPDPSRIAGKHVLLVDDVITTGATLEACARAMLKFPGVKVSVASIAVAIH
ncbi:MAG: ComF family protein [Bacteroidota bacterium]|nr:ComF family protein [Bacteroidota bacterium]